MSTHAYKNTGPVIKAEDVHGDITTVTTGGVYGNQSTVEFFCCFNEVKSSWHISIERIFGV